MSPSDVAPGLVVVTVETRRTGPVGANLLERLGVGSTVYWNGRLASTFQRHSLSSFPVLFSGLSSLTLTENIHA